MDYISKWLFISLLTVVLSSCTIDDTFHDAYGQASIGVFDPNNPNNTYNPGNDPNNPFNPNHPDFDPNNPFNPNSPAYNPNDPYATGDPGGVGPAGERSLDFPFELILDTLVAVTCPETQVVENSHFTLIAGTYFQAGGLRLSEDFLKNNDITSRTDPLKTKQLLESSPYKSARARLAFQDESNLNELFEIGGRPIQGFFPPLNNPTTIDHLSRDGVAFTTRSSSSSLVNRGGRFTASLPIPGKALIRFASGLASGTFGNALLTLTYTLDGLNPIFNSDRRLPYGRGYKLQFADLYRANYLTNIQEGNLVTTEDEGNWTCPESLRFMIHRATDRDQSHFNRAYDGYKERNVLEQALPEGVIKEGFCYTANKRERGPNSNEAAFFEILFGTSHVNSLPFELGETAVIREGRLVIIENQPCIKFKTPGCYPGGSGLYRIEFDPAKLEDCVLNEQITYRHHSNEQFYRICPAFLSVCHRTSNN